MSISYIGIMSERIDEESGKVNEKEFFIKCVKTNYEFRIVLGISYIGKSDIRIINHFRECILDIIPNTKEDSINLFNNLCGNSDLIKILQDKLRNINNTSYKEYYKEDLRDFIKLYLNEYGYENLEILCKDYYE